MKTYSILVLAVMALCTGTAAEARYSGGTGEPNDPYRIATAADLNDIGNYEEDWDKNFILVNDVNLAQYTGTQFNIIGNESNPFTGVFDGNDNRIWNFTWSSTGRNGIGLFGYVGEGGQIKNLGMENVHVNAADGEYVGGLLGKNGSYYVFCDPEMGCLVWPAYGWITNCYSTGSVSGSSHVGGLVGYNEFGMITNSYSMSWVSGYSILGGLIGNSWDGMISDCYFVGTVSGAGFWVGGLVGTAGATMIRNCYCNGWVSGISRVGGLLGDNHQDKKFCDWEGHCVEVSGYASITRCYSTASISGSSAIGGLMGESSNGSIINCYYKGSVTGKNGSHVGGLVGYSFATSIKESYFSGSVSGTLGNVGGLVGGQYYGTITNCYSTGAVAGSGSYLGGLVGSNTGSISNSYFLITSGPNNGYGTPLTDIQMKQQTSFIGWDFVDETVNGTKDYWRMCVDGVEYPLLSWQFIPDFICPDGVDIFDFAFFVGKWLAECDETNNFCNCTDTNYDEIVNFADFAILASHWLEGQ
jgi:hypothetical protein